MKNRIILGDCVQILDQIEDNSIDVVFTSPSCNWGNYGDYLGMTFPEYFRWCRVWLTKCFDKLKDTGRYAIVIPSYRDYDYNVIMYSCEYGKIIKDCGGLINSVVETGVSNEILMVGHKKITTSMSVVSLQNKNVGHSNGFYFSYDFAKEIVQCLSDKNNIILDPFCGSGTVCKAAKDLGFSYIGIEINEERYRVAQKICEE